MKLNNLNYKAQDIALILKKLGFPVKGHERADGVNPGTIKINKQVHVEFHTRPNRVRVIKEEKGLFYRSEYMRDTTDLIAALNRAGVAASNMILTAGAVTWEEGDKRGELERVFTFISEDRRSGIQLRWHSAICMKVVVLQAFNIKLPPNYDLALALVASLANDYATLTLEC